MRLLGLDFGSRRIGVAISDPTGKLAQPLTVIQRSDGGDIQEIAKIVDDYNVDEIVVGLPLSLSGEIGPQAQAVLGFIENLKGIIKIPINTWDERLTTSMVERLLVESNVKRERRKQVIDKVAATAILQSYLEIKRTGEHQS